MKKLYHIGHVLVVALTIVFFVIALFIKGFTHDVLLEAGVLLVSIKLIMMNYRNSAMQQKVMSRLDEIKDELSQDEK